MQPLVACAFQIRRSPLRHFSRNVSRRNPRSGSYLDPSPLPPFPDKPAVEDLRTKGLRTP